jgi:5,10-methylenetetrahydromethanopterin reductase
VVHGQREPRDVPIYIGATGPQMLELAGEIADGVLLNYLVAPRYNALAMERLEVGARRAGRSLEELDRPQLIVCSLDEDREVALRRARRLVTQYLGQQPTIMLAEGVPRELLEEINQVLTWPVGEEEFEQVIELVPDEVVQALTASGTPEECRARVRDYLEAGATCPVLYPLGDVRAMIDAFAVGE